ncbi:tetratricopeptide repeat protein [Burkholderia territorii]|uniref:tetratricopeptide repeat protein n=1 Tax=Burkholderia territorii TaxID=1503055 RepID=UPI0018C8757F|nr:tetratricopeptide repeat protein [Burkholderia territorii]
MSDAVSLHRHGQYDLAEELYLDILQSNPGDVEVIQQLATIEAQRGNFLKSIRLYDKVLAISPNYGVALHNRGNALFKIGRYNDALSDLRRVVKDSPKMAEAHGSLGNVLLAVCQVEKALDCFNEAIRLMPQCVEFWINRGVALLTLRRLEEALASVEHVFHTGHVVHPAAYSAYGSILIALGRPVEALASLNKAIKLSPNFVEAFVNRGAAWLALNRPLEAIDDFKRARQLTPAYIDSYLFDDLSSRDLISPDQLLKVGEKVNVNFAFLNFNESLARLLMGDFLEGWRQYEWRWLTRQGPFVSRKFSRPRWWGEALSGKTILLHCEQGLGDTIQFCRYVRHIKEGDARVILQVQPPLVSLLRQLDASVQVIGTDDSLPVFDLYCPLMSLPGVLGETVEAISSVPYIRPVGNNHDKWKGRLRKGKKKAIGVVWSGSLAHQNDRSRSIPFELFKEIMLDDAYYYCLQPEVRSTDLDALSRVMNIECLGRGFVDFSDTAEVIAMMDLIVTVDTSVAHLAGAMGKRVWILLAFSADWRWLLDRTDSPWYQSVRLFRQPAPGNWAAVLQEVRDQLEVFFAE